jgi:hypothetical protein
MNILGKVFIVLVFILSIMFMSFAIVVYTTHKNWRTEYDAVSAKLTAAKAELESRKSEYDREVEKLAAEQQAAEQQATKLETERDLLVRNNATIQKDLDDLKQKQRENTAALASTQNNNESLSAQVADLSRQKRDSELARDTQFAQMLYATEQRNQLVGQLEITNQRNMVLTSDVARMKIVLEANGINPNTSADAVTPTVDGVVSKIQRSGGVQLVEVTLGADDGLKAGDTLEVFRGSKYLGRLNIMQTSPDKSVGRVNRNFQQGQIMEGDRVATRLSF